MIKCHYCKKKIKMGDAFVRISAGTLGTTFSDDKWFHDNGYVGRKYVYYGCYGDWENEHS